MGEDSLYMKEQAQAHWVSVYKNKESGQDLCSFHGGKKFESGTEDELRKCHSQ